MTRHLAQDSPRDRDRTDSSGDGSRGHPGRFTAALCLSIAAALSVAMIGSGKTDSVVRDLVVRPVSNMQPFRDGRGGEFRTFSTTGDIDTTNPFFQDLGTNGRRCVTCHQPQDGWTITPANIRHRFEATQGEDPLFRTNDGSACAGADVASLEQRREAFRLLLDKGLIRVGISVPSDAEFTVDSVEDPYGCAPGSEVSMYRRPLPSSNVSLLSTVMWDGRETAAGQSTRQALLNQARDATLGHAQASSAPSDEQLQQIVAFETSLFSAQTRDPQAGSLEARDGRGGPIPLSRQPFFLGINDPLGGNPTLAPFTSRIFDLYDAWADDADEPFGEPPIGIERARVRRAEARRAIARGQQLFNTRPIMISGVGGLNDVLGEKVIAGSCGTCHDSPNIGHHSLSLALDLGLGDAERRTPDLPLYTLKNKTSGKLRQVTDPGRAMITGKWADIGRFKGPILRDLAARPPYFHNGSAATLRDVVDFYNTRFQIGLNEQEKSDLTAFLGAL